MPKKKRVLNCVVLTCINRPGVIWRFFRRNYFSWLNWKIERLPKLALQKGKKYEGSLHSGPVQP